MTKIVVLSTPSQKAQNNQKLVSRFLKGAKDVGHEVQLVYLQGKTMHEAYEMGKNLFTAPKETPQKPQPKPSDKIDERVWKLVLVMGNNVLPRRQIMADLGLKQNSRKVFIDNYLKPAYAKGYITFRYPSSPSKPEQAYHLTTIGLNLYAQLIKQ